MPFGVVRTSEAKDLGAAGHLLRTHRLPAEVPRKLGVSH
jgi:hypothetical protein